MSYFIFLEPDEDTYKDDETVEYHIIFSKLPSTILDWFKHLWVAEDAQPYLHLTLGCECPPGLWSVYEEEDEQPDEDFQSQNE
jgi:hypothetical protein